jgi:hypothetical protein
MNASSTSDSSKIRELLSNSFGIDYRSLALLRVGTAVAILINLAWRIPDLRSFYSDEGCVPRTCIIQLADSPWFFSLYNGTGNWLFVAALFLLAAALAVMLGIGFCTRFASIASWVMIVSLQNRNPMVVDGQDMLLRMILFWGMFLPWGNCLSIDSTRESAKKIVNATICNLATAAYTIQIVLIYFCTAVHKNTPEWINGTAGLYSLNIDFVTTSLGVYLTQFPELLKTLTFATVISEFFCPLLILLPTRSGLPRIIAIALLSSFHIGLSLVFKLGFFPLFNIISLLAFLPKSFWEGTYKWREKLEVSKWINGGLKKGSMFLPDIRISPPPWMERQNIKFVGFVLYNLLIVFFLGFVTIWNLSTLAGSGVRTPRSFIPIAHFFRLDQNWFMFAGFKPQLNGWYVMQGKLKNGKLVDIFRNGAPLSWERPKLISADYSNYHWRIYLVALFNHSYLGWRPFYADYLVREWNKSHGEGEQLEDLQIYYMHEGVLPETNHSDRIATKLFVWQCKRTP